MRKDHPEANKKHQVRLPDIHRPRSPASDHKPHTLNPASETAKPCELEPELFHLPPPKHQHKSALQAANARLKQSKMKDYYKILDIPRYPPTRRFDFPDL